MHNIFFYKKSEYKNFCENKNNLRNLTTLSNFFLHRLYNTLQTFTKLDKLFFKKKRASQPLQTSTQTLQQSSTLFTKLVTKTLQTKQTCSKLYTTLHNNTLHIYNTFTQHIQNNSQITQLYNTSQNCTNFTKKTYKTLHNTTKLLQTCQT